jgi:hypothetical protein
MKKEEENKQTTSTIYTEVKGRGLKREPWLS